jgi:hypothetical protein
MKYDVTHMLTLAERVVEQIATPRNFSGLQSALPPSQLCVIYILFSYQTGYILRMSEVRKGTYRNTKNENKRHKHL